MPPIAVCQLIYVSTDPLLSGGKPPPTFLSLFSLRAFAFYSSQQVRRRCLAADLATQQRLDRRQLIRVIFPGKADRHTRCARTASTANPVHIVVRHFRQGEVDHVADAIDVNPTARHVSGHQHADLAFAEAFQCLDALVLRHIAGQLRGVDTITRSQPLSLIRL